MTSSYFLDTSFVIALSIESDEFHSRASRLAAGFSSDGVRIVTTQAILLEIGNSFSKTRYRNLAVDFFDRADREPFFEVLSLSDNLVEAGIDLFRHRMDKTGAWLTASHFW